MIVCGSDMWFRFRFAIMDWNTFRFTFMHTVPPFSDM